MRKTRGVIVGSNAYPFLIRYWFELFKKYWQDEVDIVYFAISNPEHQSSWEYTKKLLKSHPKIQVIETKMQWPYSINFVTEMVNTDTILCMHDDTLIYKSGVVDDYFKISEKRDIIVTPLTPIFRPPDLIQELMSKKFPNQVPFTSETGEIGWSAYCNFFFMPKHYYDNTSKDFGEWHVKPGEYCKVLDWTPTSTGFDADTNFKLELELLEAGANFYGIKKNEITNINTFEDPVKELKRMRKNKEGVFDDNVGWLHLQTMAYHIYGLYYDVGEKEELERIRGGKIEPKLYNDYASFHIQSYRNTLAIRLAWIKEFMQCGDYSEMSHYYGHARKRIEEIIEFVPIKYKMVDELQKIFHDLIKL